MCWKLILFNSIEAEVLEKEKTIFSLSSCFISEIDCFPNKYNLMRKFILKFSSFFIFLIFSYTTITKKFNLNLDQNLNKVQLFLSNHRRKKRLEMHDNLTSTNFYFELLKWDDVTQGFLAASIVLTILGPLLLYCVIWYEQNCVSMTHRTIINQVLS